MTIPKSAQEKIEIFANELYQNSSEILNDDKILLSMGEFGYQLAQAQAQGLVEAGNYLDSALSGMLEGDDVECRADEECDHCFAIQACKEWSEALQKYREGVE